MITIDDKEYTKDDLNPTAQIHVERVNELRKEAAWLEMQLQEKSVLISTYANAVKQSVEIVEETDAEAVNE